VTALILVIGTYVSFIIFGPENSSGWLHLGWTWTISLILPVLVSSLISLSWFLQSLCVDSPVRIVAAKMVPFLVMTLLSTGNETAVLITVLITASMKFLYYFRLHNILKYVIIFDKNLNYGF
jgi:hypothetical protein